MASLAQLIAVYAICLAGLFLGLACYRFRSELNRIKQFVRIPLLKHFSYRPLIRSKRFAHWSRTDVLAELMYTGLNVFCLWFQC